MPRKQKNVILISLDDAISYWHYKNVFGAELITPNLDRICEQAIAFTSAYCQSPLCGPSRASFMFAKPPHHTGIFGNKRDVFTKVPPTETWSYKLKQNGYYCSSGGKVHHGYKPLSPDVHEILYTDMRKSFPIDLGITKKIEKTASGGNGGGISTTNPENDRRYYDSHSASSFIDFIENYNEDRPFYREVGFFSPHQPFITPARFKDMYSLQDIIYPEPWRGDLSGMENPYVKKNFKTQNVRNWKKSVRNYFSAFSHGDHHLGRVWDALKKSRHADNTVVIILSDHGFHLGEKGRFGKSTLLEQVAAVPLIIHDPEFAESRTVKTPVALLDIGPTVLDYADLPAMKSALGRSLRMVIEGGAPDSERVVPTLKSDSASVRYGDYRFIRYADGKTEMYNIKEDWWQKYDLGNSHPDYSLVNEKHLECCKAHGLHFSV